MVYHRKLDFSKETLRKINLARKGRISHAPIEEWRIHYRIWSEMNERRIHKRYISDE